MSSYKSNRSTDVLLENHVAKMLLRYNVYEDDYHKSPFPLTYVPVSVHISVLHCIIVIHLALSRMHVHKVRL